MKKELLERWNGDCLYISKGITQKLKSASAAILLAEIMEVVPFGPDFVPYPCDQLIEKRSHSQQGKLLKKLQHHGLIELSERWPYLIRLNKDVIDKMTATWTD